MNTRPALLGFGLLLGTGTSFLPPPTQRFHLGWHEQRTRKLRGLTEWTEALDAGTIESGVLAVLPFPMQEILLPGQTRYLHFYEEQFVRLGLILIVVIAD